MPVRLDLDQAEVGRGVTAESFSVIRKDIDVVSCLSKLTHDAAFTGAGDAGKQEERLSADSCEIRLLSFINVTNLDLTIIVTDNLF